MTDLNNVDLRPAGSMESAAREETQEPNIMDKNPNNKKIPLVIVSEDASVLLTSLPNSNKRSCPEDPEDPIVGQHWTTKSFRDRVGEPVPKRGRIEIDVLVESVQRFQIGAHPVKNSRRKALNVTLRSDLNGVRSLEVTCPGWSTVAPFIPEVYTAAMFQEKMQKERLSSICSYHTIKFNKEYFHCIWQIEQPWKSDFFNRLPGSNLEEPPRDVNVDVVVTGPVFTGPRGTTWQIIAYPYGYRSHRREGLVAMAVRYNSGPDSQISAGFQISLVEPHKLNYQGIQDTVLDHNQKLMETSKKSNVFRRGKKGWVLRKFASRSQIRQCKTTALAFVVSFCIYTREQTQHRHRFSIEPVTVESDLTSYMRRLWNSGNPAGRIKMAAKNNKVFRVHPVALQTNGGVLARIASRFLSAENPSKTPIPFPDMSEAVFRKVLEYCYTMQVTRLDKTPFELLLAAHRYDLKGLQHLAEVEIARHIDCDSVVDLYVWNEALKNNFLAGLISMFLAVNYKHVRYLEDYENKLSVEQRAQLELRYAPPVETDDSSGDWSDEEDDGPNNASNGGTEYDSGVDTNNEGDDGNFEDGFEDGLTDDNDENENENENDNNIPQLLAVGHEEVEGHEAQGQALIDQLAAQQQQVIEQAEAIAHMFGEYEMDADAMEIILMLM